MTDNSLADEIGILVDSKLKELPYPVKCKITKIYDGGFVDAETSAGNVAYVEAIGNNLAVGNTGVLIYLNGGSDECLIITK